MVLHLVFITCGTFKTYKLDQYLPLRIHLKGQEALGHLCSKDLIKKECKIDLKSFKVSLDD